MVRVRGAARPDRHETALALWRDAWLDVLLPIPIIAVGMVGTSHIAAESGERPVDALTFIVVGMAGGSLLARRRWPLVMLLVVAAALAVYTAREYPGGPVYLTGPVALYSFAAANERRVAYVAAGAMTAMLMAVRLVTRPSLGGDDLLLLPGLPQRCSQPTPCAAGASGRPPRWSVAVTWMSTVRGRRRGGSQKTGCRSPVTCTTASPTRWPRSTSKLVPPRV
jgi:hypothetical protein